MKRDKNPTWEIIQECQMITGDYDKALFLTLLKNCRLRSLIVSAKQYCS